MTGYVETDGGNDSITTAVALRDSAGRLQSVMENVDEGRDGSIDVVRESTYEYDAQGRESKYEFRQTVLAVPAASLSQVFTYSYSQTGELVTLVSEADFGDDGTLDARSSTRNVLDARGRIIESVFTQESGDGSIDVRQTDAYTYGRDGQVATARTEIDFGGDGVIETVRTYTRTLS